MPDVRCYWDTYSRKSPVADVMMKSRKVSTNSDMSTFYQQWTGNEVTDDQKKDRVWKLRPWIYNLRKNFQSVSGSEHQSVDEIMVVFKGGSILKQNMPAPKNWELNFGAVLQASFMICNRSAYPCSHFDSSWLLQLSSLLYNLPKNRILWLQRIQNQTARILTKRCVVIISQRFLLICIS